MILFYIFIVIVFLGSLYSEYEIKREKKERESFQYRGRSGGFDEGGGDSGSGGGNGR